jgi:hypothetical protein
VMVVTHADSDHVGGLIHVLNAGDIPVRHVLYNGYEGNTATWNAFATAVASEGLAMAAAQYPQTHDWGGITAHILNPVAGLTDPSQNDACVVTLLEYGTARFLFTCDISSAVEGQIVARGTPVAADILKVAHHGSKYSSSASFLAAAQPVEAIISVGTNIYGHPAQETLDRLQAAGATIWRTDQSGNIVVVSDGLSYGVTPQITLTSVPPTEFRLYLPVINHSAPLPVATPTATVPVPAGTQTPTGTAMPTSTTAPMATPTATQSPQPEVMPGFNVQCQQAGATEICASVSDAMPAQNATVTVYGRLRIDHAGQAGQTMHATWHYKTTTASCSSTTGSSGLAECSRSIGRAAIGYRVNVDVAIGAYQATTWFTPQ